MMRTVLHMMSVQWEGTACPLTSTASVGMPDPTSTTTPSVAASSPGTLRMKKVQTYRSPYFQCRAWQPVVYSTIADT